MEEPSSETSTPRRAWRLRLAALALGLGLSLGVAEIGARVLVRLAPVPKPRPPVDSALPELTSIRQIADKNQEGIWKGRYYRSNSEGFRGPDWSAEPAPGTLRILVTGDSNTMGSGVDEEEAYPYQLQARLREDASLPPVEVLNVGLGGINTYRAIARLERAIGLYSADIVVYGFTVNDIEGEHFEKLVEPAELMARTKRYQRFSGSPSRLLALAHPPVAEWVDRTFFGAVGSIDEWHYNYFENAAAWGDLEAGLARFAAVARRADACALMLVHTQLDDLGPNHPYLPMYARVTEAAEANGIPVQETFSYFAWKRPEPYWVNRFDPHPNPEGHAILAAALEAGLRALPAECWAPSH